YPFSDFLLDEEYAACEKRARSEDATENRGRDVIRQVAGDYSRTPMVQVRLEHIGRDHLQMHWELLPQALGQALVELDRYDAVRPRQQPLRQRALARPDFDDQWL